jgi:lysozyme
MTPQELTKDFEGFVPTVYKDTVGKKTIGYGFNLDDKTVSSLLPADVKLGKRPITKDEADSVFNVLYPRAREDARKFIGADTFDSLADEAKHTITDMAYNMGYNKLTGFQRFKKAVVSGDMNIAAEELKNSKWFAQVGRRSQFHYNTIKELSGATTQLSWNDIAKLAKEGKPLL